MFTTFVIVFLSTFLIVLLIRVVIRRFAEASDPTINTRYVPPQTAPTRIFTIENRSDRVISYHRSPPPVYDETVLNDLQYQIPRTPAKEFIIISDKDLPSYDDVIAQKIQETSPSNVTVVNTENVERTTTTATESTTSAIQSQSNTTVTTNNEIELRINKNNNNNNSNLKNNDIATPMVDTQLHVPVNSSQ